MKMFSQTVLERTKNLFSDRYIILGNHRDAWVFGAIDPSSGTCVMIELARAFSHLLKTGWRPRRSILFCSWSGEEYGLHGSTEWVEVRGGDSFILYQIGSQKNSLLEWSSGILRHKNHIIYPLLNTHLMSSKFAILAKSALNTPLPPPMEKSKIPPTP